MSKASIVYRSSRKVNVKSNKNEILKLNVYQDKESFLKTIDMIELETAVVKNGIKIFTYPVSIKTKDLTEEDFIAGKIKGSSFRIKLKNFVSPFVIEKLNSL